MKIVYTHENKILVENARNLLSQHGIESVVRNEYVSSGMGELAGIVTWPELWVLSDLHYAKAMSLISELLDKRNKEEWLCHACGEVNDASFEICWNCQSDSKMGSD